MNEEANKEFFDKQSAVFEEEKGMLFWSIPTEYYLFQKIFKVNLPRLSFLDIGCGNAKFFRDLLIRKYKKSFEYIGVDISPEMIKFAKKNVPSGKFHTVKNLNCVDIQKLPHNIICLFAVLQYLNFDEVKELFNKISKDKKCKYILIRSALWINRKVRSDYIYGYGYTHNYEKVKELWSDSFKIKSFKVYNTLPALLLAETGLFKGYYFYRIKMAIDEIIHTLLHRIYPKVFEARDYFIVLERK